MAQAMANRLEGFINQGRGGGCSGRHRHLQLEPEDCGAIAHWRAYTDLCRYDYVGHKGIQSLDP